MDSMNSVRLLDCTRREAPLDGLMWGELAIRKLIRGLENANVDMIEVGFLKDQPYRPGSTSFHTAEDIRPYLSHKKEGVLYTALVDYGRYDLSALSEYDGTSVDAIRVCFKHHELHAVLDYARQIRDKGYQISIQHVDTMGFTDGEIRRFLTEVNRLKPLAYSVVDTFGAMYEDDMLRLVHLVEETLDKDILLGFHGHNNLMLADANAQRFIREFNGRRDIVVDASLYGCGRSAGNAHTELLAQYMVRKHGARYDIDEILDLIDTVITAAQEQTTWGYSIPYFISGMHNAHTFNVKQLLKRHNLRSKDLRGIIDRLDETQKKAYDYALLEKLYVEYFDHPINDEAVIAELAEAFRGREILLLAPGRSVRDKRGEIGRFIEERHPVVIGVNNLIEGYRQDYVFFSGAVRYNDLRYQDLAAAGGPRLIVSSNIPADERRGVLRVNYTSLVKFGWVNLDSSAILLLRLLIRCGVRSCYAAGMDGYKQFGEAFYKNELDTGLAEADRYEHTRDNIGMMRDIRAETPDFKLRFLTESIYADIFEGTEKDGEAK